MKRVLKSTFVFVLLKSFVLVCYADASPVAVGEFVALESSAEERVILERLKWRNDIRDLLTQSGVDPLEASMRVAMLSEQEVTRLSGDMNRLPIVDDGVATKVRTIVIGFLLMLLTYTLGNRVPLSFLSNSDLGKDFNRVAHRNGTYARQIQLQLLRRD